MAVLALGISACSGGSAGPADPPTTLAPLVTAAPETVAGTSTTTSTTSTT
ncbi:MAG: hypothetical protein JWN99_1793, partial [Ilumatobacteraceae bacterium]|nr:hypothetical protein [Ilumatobacteraceae bacterium]